MFIFVENPVKYERGIAHVTSVLIVQDWIELTYVELTQSIKFVCIINTVYHSHVQRVEKITHSILEVFDKIHTVWLDEGSAVRNEVWYLHT